MLGGAIRCLCPGASCLITLESGCTWNRSQKIWDALSNQLVFIGSNEEAEGRKSTWSCDIFTTTHCDLQWHEGEKQTIPVQERCIRKMEKGVLSKGEAGGRCERKVIEVVNWVPVGVLIQQWEDSACNSHYRNRSVLQHPGALNSNLLPNPFTIQGTVRAISMWFTHKSHQILSHKCCPALVWWI